ncbi:F-box/WD repeat-containing protein, partial [Endozoicomonas numazuensis]|uniref:F-box/WD repeat-containing protein n=2 Tax=Endozoicomonas numazuensis TaxID=1137799 RepID=UPI00191C1C63
MLVNLQGKEPRHESLNTSEPSLKKAKFIDKAINPIPDEMTEKIFSYLDTRDLAVCRKVHRDWKGLIDTHHIIARSFFRDCHLSNRISPLTAECYTSSIQGWLTGFSNMGGELAEELDNVLHHEHFPEILFFSIAKVLVEAKELTCQNVATIPHFDWVNNATFSPDGNHLVTASNDNTAKIWGLVDGQWQEKATIQHDDCVNGASFSPDGNHLVTTSKDNTAKIWGLVDGQWQEKAIIQHSMPVNNACFSPDGNYLVTASDDHTAEVWGLVDGQWQKKFTIQDSSSVNSVTFSPDENHLVTVSDDDTVKVWGLVDGQWQKKATIPHSKWVNSANFSPDGNHLVTASEDNTAKIWGLVDGQWQEKAIIQHD